MTYNEFWSYIKLNFSNACIRDRASTRPPSLKKVKLFTDSSMPYFPVTLIKSDELGVIARTSDYYVRMRFSAMIDYSSLPGVILNIIQKPMIYRSDLDYVTRTSLLQQIFTCSTMGLIIVDGSKYEYISGTGFLGTPCGQSTIADGDISVEVVLVINSKYIPYYLACIFMQEIPDSRIFQLWVANNPSKSCTSKVNKIVKTYIDTGIEIIKYDNIADRIFPQRLKINSIEEFNNKMKYYSNEILAYI